MWYFRTRQIKAARAPSLHTLRRHGYSDEQQRRGPLHHWAQSHAPGWTLQPLGVSPAPISGDAQRASLLAKMKATIAAVQSVIGTFRERKGLVASDGGWCIAAKESRKRIVPVLVRYVFDWGTPFEFGSNQEKFSSPPKICGTTE